MSRSLSLALIAGLTLGGCNGGGGPSVAGSADESTRSETGLSSLWERVRGTSIEQTKTIEMPAFALIADAIGDDAAKHHMDGRTVRKILTAHDDGRLPNSMLTQVDMLTAGLHRDRPAVEMQGGVAEHFTLGLLLFAAVAPLQGWEVNPMSDEPVDPVFNTPFFKQNRAAMGPAYNQAEHAAYMEMLAVSAAFANEVFTEIASKMQGITIADPDAAKRRVMAIYRSLPAAALRAKLAELSERADSARYITDLAGSRDIRFQAGGLGDFTGDGRGVVWTKSGTMWFGDNHINGQTTNFRLAAASSLSQRQAQTGSTNNTTGAAVTGNSSINGGR